MLCGSEVMSESVIICCSSVPPVFESYRECDRSKSPIVGAIYINAYFTLINIYVTITWHGYNQH